jgi:cytidylate kinase
VDLIEKAIAERDHLDSSREDSPLRPHEDSIIVDSSAMPINDVVEVIAQIFEQREKESGRG